MKTFQEWLKAKDQEQLDEVGAIPLAMAMATQAPGQSSLDQINALTADIDRMHAEKDAVQQFGARLKKAIENGTANLDDPQVHAFLLANPQLDPRGPAKDSQERAGWEADQRLKADKNWKDADFNNLLRKSLEDGKAADKKLQGNLQNRLQTLKAKPKVQP